jgi:queuine tRNA-ribosyltransferase
MKSAEFIAAIGAEGNAIGGLSVGEPAEMMYEMTEKVCSILPKDKPRYLMGVGTPANLLECIALGIDMFDCVMPTRNGRNGMLFTRDGIINIKNEKWKNDHSPVDPQANSFVDQAYSRAFLRHLFVAGEMLGPMIATVHNLGFYLDLMREVREEIKKGSFAAWKNVMVEKLQQRI